MEITKIVKLVLDWLAVIIIPLILFLFLIMAQFKQVKVYEKFVEGAKEGFQVGVRIIPYLVAMLVAIAMFRASGAMDILTWLMRPVTDLIGMPAEVLPMALMRPLSGSGSIGVMTELMKTYGPDSLIGFIASTMYGSSETTFYVIAVYFGAINVQKTRYALPAGLTADAIGLIMATFICRAFF
jgi:spore maturation protein B